MNDGNDLVLDPGRHGAAGINFNEPAHWFNGPVNFADPDDAEDEDFVVIEDGDGLLRLL